nr:MAG TPA: hypothetical protein [Caudoviricetes sp.]DAY92725.1 MAG TPA: hypothetical protein [Caudoviricetes sp.]
MVRFNCNRFMDCKRKEGVIVECGVLVSMPELWFSQDDQVQEGYHNH